MVNRPWPLPPLNALKAFEAVGRLGSVRRAAESLSVSHTAVARHIRKLEDWIGVPLIQAGPRGSCLTPEGQKLMAETTAAFQRIAAAAEALRPRARRGELRIWCVPGLATRWLAPHLATLEALLPDTEIALRPTDAVPDLARRDADIEIRFRLRDAPGVRACELMQPRFFPVASPEFLAAYPPVRQPADLVTLPLIHEDTREQWRDWLAAAGAPVPERLEGPRVWYANVATDAAVMGRGVALTNRYLAGADLAAGRLVEMLATDIRLGAYVMQAAAERWDEPAIARVRSWLLASLAEPVAT